MAEGARQSPQRTNHQLDLLRLAGTGVRLGTVESLARDAAVLRGFAVRQASDLVEEVARVAAVAPFRHMTTPGGFRMSVAMTGCGSAVWVTDRRGYRYERYDPGTGRPWPDMPAGFLRLALAAAAAAGFAGFVPDSCLINRYAPGTRLSLHQDKDEQDYTQPIVSVSLGLPAVFLFGGAKRSDRQQRVPLYNGDVVVWGGTARLFHHGVSPLAEGDHPLTGPTRINLTFRKAL